MSAVWATPTDNTGGCNKLEEFGTPGSEYLHELTATSIRSRVAMSRDPVLSGGHQ